MLTPEKLPPPPPGRRGWPWTLPPATTPVAGPTDGPRISIVMPSYNQAAFIEAALRSVLLQDYDEVELLVVDGDSMDESAAIIKRYADFLPWWVSKADRGQSHAINKGLSRSSGDILAWLNSDDVLAPGALHHVAALLDGRAMSLAVGASIITSGPDTLGGRLDRRRPTYDEMVYDARTFPQPSVFWTRDLWTACGPLDESLYYLMDYEYWLRLRHRAREVIFSDQVLSYARTHPAQKSRAAEQDGAFQRARVQIALAAARRRGESPYRWLATIWMRRARRAIRLRKLALLRGGDYHRLATRAVLGRGG